jgi:dTMP kinase
VTGRFITLEGGEGVGKSTQSRRLADALKARGIEVIETREPGGSAGAEAIRNLLLEGTVDRWSARTEALLFAAARADHVASLIRPALDKGAWVLCDRFLDSSLAYQGGASGISEEDILRLHHFGSIDLLPDRTLLLALPIEVAAQRAGERDAGRTDRFGRRGVDYHQRVAGAFDRLAERFPQRIRKVEAEGAPERVTEKLLAEIADLL